MTRTMRAAAIAALTALAAIAAIIAADFTTPAQAQSDDETSGRIVARRLSDGRTELGWQQRANGGWGERVLPRVRYIPAAASIDRWLRTSPVEVAGVEIGRIEARKRRDGGIELAFTPTGGERILPSSNYLPANAQVDRWLNSTEITSDPLKIAFLADYSGAIAEFGPAIETGVRLAVKHLNDAGGVFGQPVQVVTGDTGLNSTRAVEEARRLIEVEGAHAIVGPLASRITLAVAESVTGPANIPTISPSATLPQITLADDNGFLFRSTVSDAAQGPVLAQLAADEGYSNVSVLYVDNAYGQGLAEAFLDSWGGESVSVAYAEGQTSYLAELQNVAGANGEVLIAVGYPTEAQVYIREALENGIFDTFLFVDGTKSQDLIDAIGQGFLNGMKGTAPSSGPESDSLRNFNAAYTAEYGELPSIPFVREAYDAAVAIGLAAASAGSTDGVLLRDHLRMVAAPDGAVISAGAEGVAAGLRALANGESVNYEGAATTVDWNAAGDVTTGFIGVWQFANGAIEEVSVQAIDLGEVTVAWPRDTGAVVAGCPEPTQLFRVTETTPVARRIVREERLDTACQVDGLPRGAIRPADRYAFTLDKPSRMSVELRSTAFPAHLFLTDANGAYYYLDGTEAEGGRRLSLSGSRAADGEGDAIIGSDTGYLPNPGAPVSIPASLKRVRLEPGSYWLFAVSASGSRTGDYRLTVEYERIADSESLDQRIAERFAPVLLFEEGEQFFPVPVELMIRNSTLHYTQNGQERAKAPGTYGLADLISHNGRESYLDLADADHDATGDRVVYARVTEIDGADNGVLVQYWFFYLYNATGTGSVSLPIIGNPVDADHEGDWEGVQLWFAGLSPDDLLTASVPTQLGYAAHESGWAFRRNAESCAETNARLAPSVYVARNRHASYIAADGGGSFRNWVGLSATDLDKSLDKQDQFQGNGEIWALRGLNVPDVEGELGYEIRMLPTDLNQSWLAWDGRWGDVKSGSDGPRGPAFKSHFWAPPVFNGHWSVDEFTCFAR